MEGIIFLQDLPTVPKEIVPTGNLRLVDDLTWPLDYALLLQGPYTVYLILHAKSGERWRRNIAVLLETPGAVVKIFTLLRGKNPNLSLSLRHLAAETTSHCTLQSIAEDRCFVQIQTHVTVDPKAHSCQAHLRSRSLILSPESRVQVSPRMDIGAVDARCTHGATLGGSDPEQHFYFASRGLDQMRAKQLLTTAAVAEILKEIPSK